MVKIKFLLYILVLSISLIWIGCKKETGQDPVTISLERTGNLQFSFKKTLATESIDTVTALLTRSGYTSIRQDLAVGAGNALGIIYNIPEGLWELTVEAKDSAGIVLYRGRASVNIQGNQPTNVSIVLTPSSSSGYLLIDISWEQEGNGKNWTKYSNNPVLDLGSPGSWDAVHVDPRTILFDGTEYKMWYQGCNGSIYSIGYATSTDGINWIKYSGNPVLSPGSSGSWDGSSVAGSMVLYDGSIYKMWYLGTNGSLYRIGYATSPDGINWTKYSGNPILSPGPSGSWDARLECPAVIYDGSIYKMWYDGYNGTSYKIGYATSTDGINWIKYSGNPVLSPGSSSSWDDLYVLSASVIHVGDEYKMWYSGHDGSAFRIGYAVSTDGINWTKSTGNPVIDIGTTGAWDNKCVSDPRVIFDGTNYKMWYSGSDGTHRRIGYATCP